MMGYRQVGKPTDFDSVIRRFESCYPIQFLAPAKNWMSRRSLSEGGLIISHLELRITGSTLFGTTVLLFSWWVTPWKPLKHKHSGLEADSYQGSYIRNPASVLSLRHC